MPGIAHTGEPPSFRLTRPARWISPGHPDWATATDFLTFDSKDDADRWLIEYLLERPPVHPEETEYEVDTIAVTEEALWNWEPYRGS